LRKEYFGGKKISSLESTFRRLREHHGRGSAEGKRGNVGGSVRGHSIKSPGGETDRTFGSTQNASLKGKKKIARKEKEGEHSEGGKRACPDSEPRARSGCHSVRGSQRKKGRFKTVAEGEKTRPKNSGKKGEAPLSLGPRERKILGYKRVRGISSERKECIDHQRKP